MTNGVRVGKSTVAGRGLFATKTFFRGDTICEYSGKLIRGPYPAYRRYLFAIDDLWTLDGSPMSNIGRWANHSCKPNADYDITTRKRVWLYARKRINPGDEITFDYGGEYVEGFLNPCRCPACK